MNLKVKYSKELLEKAAKDSLSIAQVITVLGLKQAGGTHSHIKRRLKFYNIDTSHFLGSRVNSGIRHKRQNKLTPEQVFSTVHLSGNRVSAKTLRRALIESGTLHECAICGQPPEWQGKPLVLQIDHINGLPLDNRKENLRFLCGHCHSQTPTFGSKKRKVLSHMDEIRKIEDRNFMKAINKAIKTLEAAKKEECQHNWVLDGHNCGEPICSKCYKRPHESSITISKDS